MAIVLEDALLIASLQEYSKIINHRVGHSLAVAFDENTGLGCQPAPVSALFEDDGGQLSDVGSGQVGRVFE